MIQHNFGKTSFFIFFESKYTKQLILNGSSKAYKYHGISRFVDDFFAISDGNEAVTSFRNIYPKELELKVEHQGNHTSFLGFDIKIEDSVVLYNIFDKRDILFSFLIVRMPHFSSNIPSTTFYGSVFSEFLRIATCTLKINDFIPRASDLFLRMIAQGGNRATQLNNYISPIFTYF